MTFHLHWPLRSSGEADSLRAAQLSPWRGFSPWGALAIFALGVGVLARAYLAPPDSAMAYGLFWGGLGLCFTGCAAVGLQSERPVAHALTLALFGAAMYLPIFLRGADRPHFNDELFHIQLLEFMAELGTREVPLTLYPLPGDYPGLELIGLAIMRATGLPLITAARVTVLLLHMLIPVTAYYALSQCALSPRSAFLGALVYIANTSYFFIHSIFSYETLGIVLFLLLAGVCAQMARARPDRRQPLSLLGMAVMGAVVVTHHFTGMMALGLLAALTVAATALRHDSGLHFRVQALVGVGMWLAWLIVGTRYSWGYLQSTIETRIAILGDTAASLLWPGQAEAQVRPLFKVSTLPQWERIYAFSYPVLVALLSLLGLWVAYRALRARSIDGATAVVWVALSGWGPCLWLVSTVGVVTGSSDAVFRSWPFLFLGVALFVIVGLEGKLRRRAPAAMVAAAAMLLVGGVIIGDNQTGRFRSPEPAAAAGGTTITADLMAAAEWLRQTDGSLNRVAGDLSSQVAFAAIGRQITPTWGIWTIYFEPNPARAAALMQHLAIDHVVVDWRVTRLPPRNQYAYYGKGEPMVAPMPAELLEKFAHIPELSRVYDNGDIVIYRRRDGQGAQ